MTDILDRLKIIAETTSADWPTASIDWEYREAVKEIERLRAELDALYAMGAGDAERSEAYDAIDHFLRSSLDDDEYAEYSSFLETVWGAPQPAIPDDWRKLAEVLADFDHYAEDDGEFSERPNSERVIEAATLARAMLAAAPKPGESK